MKGSIQQVCKIYQERFTPEKPRITEPPLPDTALIIVIPVYDEPGLLLTLGSLEACHPPSGSAEVILVVNSSSDSPEEVKKRNLETLEDARNWAAKQKSQLRFHFIHSPALPPKHAGVGLARKTGMDEALFRFASIDKAGAIVCLDADCTVSPNYLVQIKAAFANPAINTCPVYFEHDLEVEQNSLLREGIIRYELFLRYYVQALRFSGFPFAFHTVGSSMAVRADVYARQGGMNKRKAGEDFYFLHKLMPLGGIAEINRTTVFPSCRLSHRVPFGTGRAQQHWLEKRQVNAYHPAIFEELSMLFSFQDNFWKMQIAEIDIWTLTLPEELLEFLLNEQFMERIRQMKNNASSRATFQKRFFSWMDGFRVLKLIHWLRDRKYGELPVEQAACKLLEMKGIQPEADAVMLLHQFRLMDNPCKAQAI